MKKIIVLFLISFLFLQNQIMILGTTLPEVQIFDTTAQKGEQTSLSIYMRDFEQVSVLDVIVIYDTKYVEYVSSEIYYNLRDANDITTIINDTVNGQIRFTLLAPSGLDYTGYLSTIQFQVKEETEINSYPIIGAVGEAYDINNNPMEVSVRSGFIHVIERTEYRNLITYYESLSSNYMKEGEVFTWSIYAYNLYGMTAGMYELLYDENLFELVEVTFGSGFSNSFKDINDATNGRILMAFISENEISQGDPLITLRLKVKENIQVVSSIQFIPRQIYDTNLELIGGNNLQRDVYIEEVIPEEENSLMYVTSYEGKILDEVILSIYLGEDANVSSGDFSLNYDGSRFKLETITVMVEDAWIIYDHDENNHVLTFSLISTKDIVEITELIQLTFVSKSEGTLFSSQVNLSGSNVFNSSLESVDLDYVGGLINFNSYAFQFGDLNKDGLVSVYDLLMMELYLLGQLDLDEMQMKLFDINGDDNLNNEDISLIKESIFNQ